MNKNLKTLVISRKRWLRGNPRNSFLLHPKSNKMCCLGFLARDCGYKPKEIRNVLTPTGFYEKYLWPKKLLTKNNKKTALCDALMWINDDGSTDDETREKKLKILFKKIGYDLVFEG